MNLNLCIVCLIHKNELVHYMILAMSIGPLYVIVIYYINIFVQESSKSAGCVENPLPNPNWCAVETPDKHSTLGIFQEDSQKKLIFWVMNQFSSCISESKRKVLIHHMEVPCSECIFLTVGCRVVRPCTVEQSAQRSTSCPQPMY